MLQIMFKLESHFAQKPKRKVHSNKKRQSDNWRLKTFTYKIHSMPVMMPVSGVSANVRYIFALGFLLTRVLAVYHDGSLHAFHRSKLKTSWAIIIVMFAFLYLCKCIWQHMWAFHNHYTQTREMKMQQKKKKKKKENEVNHFCCFTYTRFHIPYFLYALYVFFS